MKTLAVSLATEGDLDEQVLRQLLQQSGRQFYANVCYGRRGRDHLKQNISRFNQAARVKPFIVLADLDRDECAPVLLQEWLPSGLNRNLILRIAVRAIESWLFADCDAFAKFLGVSAAILPHNPDEVVAPKSQVIQLASRSRFRQIRQDIAPPPGSTSRVGRNYVGQLSRFVLEHWQAKRAARNSPSLDKAIRAIREFSP